ncbi:hypothetical protein AB433_13295 [Croceicoccus naphthovorans]|uniref:Uncharacterized protein n=1 Tax=Croceicoccus naphthovorans TaxID=1348774 RepID=A0A0G3XMF6_9SPHN|nr:hypothetical protein AB433_13295 [Croceicoccus naphthovorans]
MSLFPALAMAAPAFTDPGPVFTDSGQVQIEWTSDEPVTLTLTPEGGAARDVYRGDGGAVFLSGLAEGDYRMELTGDSGAVSEALAVEVGHQSLTLALWLAAVGALVFMSTIVVIVRGARDGEDAA